jgi:hypothetical protein
MKLTIPKFESADTCHEGIDLWRRYAGEVYEVDDYGLEDQLAFIRGPLGSYWGWAVSVGVIPAWSMCGVDFSGADLRHADLRFADLRYADLRRADLRRTDLRGAILYRADLREANLRRADLHRADLREARLEGADIKGADVRAVIGLRGVG